MDSLKKNQDFRTVYHKGRSAADSRIVLYMLDNDLQKARLGISVSKKYGNSVKRHLFQRRIREIFRHHAERIEGGRDYVVIARMNTAAADYHMLEESVVKLLSRFHAIKPAGDER